jgi:hypothetical protein
LRISGLNYTDNTVVLLLVVPSAVVLCVSPLVTLHFTEFTT